MLGRPGFAVGEIRHETFEVAVLVPFGYARALHHSARAFFHAAITRNRYVAARTVGPRHQLPTSSPAERTILKSHNRCRLLPGVLNLCTAYERGGSAASHAYWENCGSVVRATMDTKMAALQSSESSCAMGLPSPEHVLRADWCARSHGAAGAGAPPCATPRARVPVARPARTLPSASPS